jgi:hypothetical protein
LFVCYVDCGDWFVHCWFDGLLVWLADPFGAPRYGGQRRRPRRRRLRLRVLDYVATRLRVCGGAFWAAMADVHLGASRACVRVLDLAAWLSGFWVLDGLPGASCWRHLRRWRPRCCGTGGRGRARVGRWVGRWQCSVSMVLCRVVVRKNETASAAFFVCLLVMLIVAIGLFIAGLTACLCARRSTARRTTTTATVATRPACV